MRLIPRQPRWLARLRFWATLRRVMVFELRCSHCFTAGRKHRPCFSPYCGCDCSVG